MKIEAFSKWTFSEIILLVITFLLGMDINLYINLPTNISTASFWENPNTWIIRIHMLIGTVILAIAILLLINSFKFKYIKRNIKVPSIIGLISVVVAYFGGISFLFFGINSIFSYIMAIGFILAIIDYVFLAAILGHEKH